MQVLHWVALGFLVAVYGGSGLVELPLWRRHVAQYTAWGYPFYWAIVTPLVKFTAGILLLLPQTRVLGILLCVLVGVGATATVFLFRTRSMYLSVIIVLLLTLLSTASLLVAPNDALAVPVAATLTPHAAPLAVTAPVQPFTDRALETGSADVLSERGVREVQYPNTVVPGFRFTSQGGKAIPNSCCAGFQKHPSAKAYRQSSLISRTLRYRRAAAIYQPTTSRIFRY